MTYHHDELRVRWHVRRYAHADGHGRERIVAELAGDRELSRRVLEAFAFSRDDVAEPGSDEARLRERALFKLWELEASGAKKSYFARGFILDIPAERLARFLAEARGLERRWLLREVTLHQLGADVVVEALALVMLTDPLEEMSAAAARTLAEQRPAAAWPAFRAAVQSPHVLTRRVAVDTLADHLVPENRAALEATLEHQDVELRARVALLLADRGHDAGVPLLVGALSLGTFSPHRFAAVPRLGRLRERRAVRALVALFDALEDHRDRSEVNDALEQITGERVYANGRTWAAWWAAHSKDFPAQLDPGW